MDQAATIHSAAVDEYGRPVLRVFAPLAWKLTIAPFSFGLGAFMATVYLRDPSGFPPLYRYLTPTMAAFFLVGAVEYIQRVFLFYPDRVRIRILWVWRTIRLPDHIKVGVNRNYQVILTDVATGRRCLRVPRDFTGSGRLATELATYYQGWQRLGDEGV